MFMLKWYSNKSSKFPHMCLRKLARWAQSVVANIIKHLWEPLFEYHFSMKSFSASLVAQWITKSGAPTPIGTWGSFLAMFALPSRKLTGGDTKHFRGYAVYVCPCLVFWAASAPESKLLKRIWFEMYDMNLRLDQGPWAQ